MSIVTSVKVSDGIVLGADSRTQLIGKGEKGVIKIVKSYNHAQKLFGLEGKHFGILTYGIGNIGRRSVESYIIEFTNNEKLLGIDNNLKNIAQNLLSFFKKAYLAQYEKIPKEQRPILGVYIAGYSEDNPLAEEWEFLVPIDGEVRRVRSPKELGSSWRGMALPFTRLQKGYDPRIIKELEKKDIPPKYLKVVVSTMQQFKAQIIYDGMPLQDAIHLCRLILSTTVGVAKFEAGNQTCGGPLDIAVITRSEGFGWIKKKKLKD